MEKSESQPNKIKQPIHENHVFISMRRTLAKNLSANSLQLLINHGFSLLVFLLLARELGKQDFGLFNWMLAVLLTIFSILSFGIDQLLVKNTAMGKDPSLLISVGLFHNLWTGLGLIILLSLASFFTENFPIGVMIFLSVGKLAFSLAVPYKQVMAGMERFDLLLPMSVVSNAAKAAGIGMLFLLDHTDLLFIALVFLLADLFEMGFCMWLFHKTFPAVAKKTQVMIHYKKMVKEALPQLGTVIFAAALARFDWILIGIILPRQQLAEYSFAYKVFELSLLPMLVIAPLLVPRFTKKSLDKNSELQELKFLFRMEMILACVIVLMLNLLWQPVAGWISDGKYGAVNTNTIFILSLSMPLLYYNNFLWSLHFSKGRTNLIFRIFAFTFLINALLNCILIPSVGVEGAALAFLGAIFMQTVLYHWKEEEVNSSYWFILFTSSFAALGGLAVTMLIKNPWLSAPAGIFVFLALLIFSGNIGSDDRKNLFRILKA
ncbi:MAG: oligosaccharide flippase family protein [Flavisolibacter sp.]|jgi:O-antigen/teichoic acid export membrane protein|nr:oligosaccharide flippase family protein [Flavisolibacter sp.]